MSTWLNFLQPYTFFLLCFVAYVSSSYLLTIIHDELHKLSDVFVKGGDAIAKQFIAVVLERCKCVCVDFFVSRY